MYRKRKTYSYKNIMNEIRLYVHGYITAASLVSHCVLNIYIENEIKYARIHFLLYSSSRAIMTIIIFKRKTKKNSTSLLARHKKKLSVELF